MNPELSFFIEGHPAPGGSKTFFPVWRKDGTLVTERRGPRIWPIIRVVDDAGEANKNWKAIVAVIARKYMGAAKPFEEPVNAEFIFHLRRPLSHYRTGKFAHLMHPEAPAFHVQKPDALKLARSTEDALTGVIWKDDSSNVRITSEKRWVGRDEKEGCAVRIMVIRSPLPA